jgi:hypothetical protein
MLLLMMAPGLLDDVLACCFAVMQLARVHQRFCSPLLFGVWVEEKASNP